MRIFAICFSLLFLTALAADRAESRETARWWSFVYGGAMNLGTRGGSRAYGFGIGATKEQAEEQAAARCRQDAGRRILAQVPCSMWHAWSGGCRSLVGGNGNLPNGQGMSVYGFGTTVATAYADLHRYMRGVTDARITFVETRCLGSSKD